MEKQTTYRYAGFEGGNPTTTTPDEVQEIYNKMMSGQGFILVKVPNGSDYWTEAQN